MNTYYTVVVKKTATQLTKICRDRNIFPKLKSIVNNYNLLCLFYGFEPRP